MAVIGSLTVDLILKTANFIANLDKTAGSVKKNTDAIRSSMANVEKSIGAVLGARAIRQIVRFAQECINLAATIKGPLGIAARDFQNKMQSVTNAFQLGVAKGFMDELLKSFKVSGEQVAQIGILIGETLAKAFNQIIQFITVDIPQGINQSISQLNSLVDWYNRAAEARDKAAGMGAALTGGAAGTGLTGGEQGGRITPIPALEINAGTDALEAYRAGLQATTQGQRELNVESEIFRDIVAASEKLYAQTRTPMEQYAIALQDIKDAHADGELAARAHMQATANLAGEYLKLADGVAGALGTLFKDSKAVAVAQAVINTAQAITATLAQYGATPWGLAASAVAAASGAAQIATIMSAQPGSGKKPAVGGAGKAAKTKESGGGGGQTMKQAVSINLMGSGGFTRDQVRQLAQQLNGLVADGATIAVN